MIKIQNYIGGELIDPVSNQFLPNTNPALGEVYSQVPDSDERDVELAVQAAQKAFPAWSSTPEQERCNIMMRIAEMIELRLDHFVKTEVTDSGKTVSLASSLDIPRAALNFKFYATAAVQFASEANIMESGTVN